MKKSILLSLTILLVFIGSGFLAYLMKQSFRPECYNTISYNNFINSFNEKFVEKEYAELKDLAKSFLTILVAVFVASITFSEKIVNFNTSTWWSKSLLIVCWVLLLLSIVLTGSGLVFLTSSFNQAIYVPCPDNIDLYMKAFFCFVFSGLAFGLALASMLCAGIISFIQPKKV
jgi:hypothetical protein